MDSTINRGGITQQPTSNLPPVTSSGPIDLDKIPGLDDFDDDMGLGVPTSVPVSVNQPRTSMPQSSFGQKMNATTTRPGQPAANTEAEGGLLGAVTGGLTSGSFHLTFRRKHDITV